MTSDEEVIEIARKEFDLLQRIDHPSIVSVLEFFTSANRAVIAMPFFDGESLLSTVRRLPDKRMPEERAHPLFEELLKALDYLHGCRIVHRDVKPENVLIKRDVTDTGSPMLQLIDFNISRYLPEGGALSPNCTPQYAAPEVRMGGSPSEASDIWGAGLCLCMMLSGHCPRVEVVQSGPVLDGRELFSASAPCQLMVQQCLVLDHSMRPAAMTLLQSTWILYGPPAGGKDLGIQESRFFYQESATSTEVSGAACQGTGMSTPRSDISRSASWSRPASCEPAPLRSSSVSASHKVASPARRRSKSCGSSFM
jgi:serine/threonine protein kinase